MAKNRSMAIKHAKAKRESMKEIMDNAKCEMCCKTIPKNIHKYSTNEDVFYSKFAIQRRIDMIVGRHYPANKFREKWNEVYEYITTHTVPDTKIRFKETIFVIRELN